MCYLLVYHSRLASLAVLEYLEYVMRNDRPFYILDDDLIYEYTLYVHSHLS
jgi:hypothetical protein